MTPLRTTLALLALVATGLLAGFFYAYPSSVSPGLQDLSDAGYVRGMQSINEAVPNGLFVISFVGAPALLLLATIAHRGTRRFGALLIATLLVVVGGLLVTFAFSVPLNDDLAETAVREGPGALAQAREDYQDPWNAWNAVRVLACSMALASVGVALTREGATSARS